MGKALIKVGDIVEIPLPNNKKAFAQYAFKDKQLGAVVRIFDHLVDVSRRIRLDELVSVPLRFPPVFIAGINTALRSGRWKVIGSLPVDNFTLPKYVSTLPNPKTGEATVWFLIDGRDTIRVGKYLPTEFKKLEFHLHLTPHVIEERIITREKPYDRLIKTNKIGKTPIRQN